MSKSTSLDQLQRLLDFIREYAEQHPDFKKQLEAALRTPGSKKLRPMTPYEYVEEHGLHAFRAHVQEADMDTLTGYARYLKLKVFRRKQVRPEELRQTIIDTMDVQMAKGSAFVSHS